MAPRGKLNLSVAAIVIRDNPFLEDIVFGDSNNVRAIAIPTLMVRGNRKLSNETINKLNALKAGARASKRNSIQAFGECSVPKPLKNLSDLIGCEWLHGDIKIERNQRDLLPPREPLKQFTLTGCVIVKHTVVENIDFLRNLREQRFPAWLCQNGVTMRAGAATGDEAKANDDDKAKNTTMWHLLLLAGDGTPFGETKIVCSGGVVTLDYIVTTIAGHHCAIIRGDLIIKNWTGDSSVLQDLKSVRKILGELRLEGNLRLKKVDFLTGLEEVEVGPNAKSGGVIIRDNPILEEVQLVSLKKVISYEIIAVIIENNPRLAVDLDEWYEIAGGENRTKLLLTYSEDRDGEGIVPLLVKITAAIVFVLVLVLTVYWFGWGTRWRKFSGLVPDNAKTPVVTRH
ncbi:unnamed protein product [Haemonchus placei]|uniref:Recep_L_domain domain-containing protein n=1 Tax=Haemonchus placei TaxID=6290 RepID=A0A158QQF7_HAEPC|nr:unnamed protein product [Haemonchus placei]